MRFRRFPKELTWFNCSNRFCDCFDSVIHSNPIDKIAICFYTLFSVINCTMMCLICFPFVIIRFIYEITKAYLKLLQWCLHWNSQEDEEKIQAYIKRKTTENT